MSEPKTTPFDPLDLDHLDRSEYGVARLHWNPATASLICFAVAFALGLMARYAHWAWVLGYGRWVRMGFYVSLAAAAAGLVFGVRATRNHPDQRLLGILGASANGVVLVLEILFLLLFRWIARFTF